jgi:nitrogen fixation protein FixH
MTPFSKHPMQNETVKMRGTGKKEFTGRHMLLLMLAFFAVVLLANGTLVVVAMNNWSGLVVPNSYVASQKFNAAIDEAQVRAGKDWRGSFDIDENGRAILTLRDGKGLAVAGRQVRGHAARPTHEKADQDLTFREVESGTYQVQEDLATGVWLLTVRVEGHQGLDYANRFRLTVP